CARAPIYDVYYFDYW
nr:immunoglobulin heavy chain junction region [Mus musculus]